MQGNKERAIGVGVTAAVAVLLVWFTTESQGAQRKPAFLLIKTSADGRIAFVEDKGPRPDVLYIGLPASELTGRSEALKSPAPNSPEAHASKAPNATGASTSAGLDSCDGGPDCGQAANIKP